MTHRPRQDSVCDTMAENDDPQDWPPLTAFYHYAGPSSSSSQSNAPSSTAAVAEATTTNASPPPIAVTTTYNNGATSTTNHTAPVTILIFQNPIHPSFVDNDDDDKNGNKNESDPPLDLSRSPPQPRRCAGCHKDFASTTTTTADADDADADADDDDIATFPVLAGPHCDCTFHAGCLAQPYFDRATLLPVRRRNVACPACGGEGFAGREAEMGCWEDEDDGWEGEGIVSERDGGGCDGDDDDDDIVQFEMVPREEAAAAAVVVTEGMVVVRLESEWEEEEEQEQEQEVVEVAEVAEVAEGKVVRRAVAFAVIVKWASGDDGEGGKEGEEGKQAQQDAKMPGDSVLPGCERQLASLDLDQPQKQQQIQEKTVTSAEKRT